MAPTAIHIQGHATINAVAERAALSVNVSDSGYDKDQVAKNVIGTVNTLQEQLDLLCPRLDDGEGDIAPDAPVSFYSISSLTTSSRDENDDDDHRRGNYYPGGGDGGDNNNRRSGKLIYTVKTNLDIRFRDFGKLGELVVQLSSTPYVQLAGIDWSLTDEKRVALMEEVRMDALRHAIRRANSFAEIISRSGSVTPVKIQDDQEYWLKGRVAQTARKAAVSTLFGAVRGIDFEPQLIEVSGTLEVEFHAE